MSTSPKNLNFCMKYCICNNFFLSFQLEEELLEYKSIAEKTCEVCSRMNTRHRVALSSAGETGEHSLVAVNVVWISHWMISTEVEKGIIFCSNKGLYSGSIRAVSHFLLSIGLVLSILIDLFFIPFWPFWYSSGRAWHYTNTLFLLLNLLFEYSDGNEENPSSQSVTNKTIHICRKMLY